MAAPMMNAVDVFKGYIHTKNQFLTSTPHIIILSRDRSKAKIGLEQVHEIKRRAKSLSAAYASLDPVTIKFFDPATGEYGKQMEDWAHNGNLSIGLSLEIESYEIGIMDDSVAEGIHRELTMLCRLASGRSFAGLASTYRLGQNLDLYKLMKSRGDLPAFLIAWQRRKTVLSIDYNKKLYTKLTNSGYAEKVYNCGEACSTDHGLAPHLFKDLPRASGVHRMPTEIIALQLDFVKASWPRHGLVSLPCVPSHEHCDANDVRQTMLSLEHGALCSVTEAVILTI
jgi:hypothetical protein